MNEQENTRIVQKAYENFKNGDLPGLLDLYSDDIDWRLPSIESMPFFGPREGCAKRRRNSSDRSARPRMC